MNDVIEDSINTSVYGIRVGTDLNLLDNFHITKNYMYDTTHDIWEGIGKLETCLLINQFVKIDKFFDLNFLNNRINN